MSVPNFSRHAEIFHLKSQNFILLVVLEEKSGDHQTQWTSSLRAHLFNFHLVAAIFQSGQKLRAKLSKAAKLTEQYRGQEEVCVVTCRSIPMHPEFKLTK